MNRFLVGCIVAGAMSLSMSGALASAHAKMAVKQVVSVVDVNRATAAELATLKGLGLKKAQEIVMYRQKHGEFKQLSELTALKGIGKKTLLRLKNNNPGRLVVSVAKK